MCYRHIADMVIYGLYRELGKHQPSTQWCGQGYPALCQLLCITLRLITITILSRCLFYLANIFASCFIIAIENSNNRTPNCTAHGKVIGGSTDVYKSGFITTAN